MKRRGWAVGILATFSGGSRFKSRPPQQHPNFFLNDLTVSFQKNTRQDIAITQNFLSHNISEKSLPATPPLPLYRLYTWKRPINPTTSWCKILVYTLGWGWGYSVNKFNCFKTSALIWNVHQTLRILLWGFRPIPRPFLIDRIREQLNVKCSNPTFNSQAVGSHVRRPSLHTQ